MQRCSHTCALRYMYPRHRLRKGNEKRSDWNGFNLTFGNDSNQLETLISSFFCMLQFILEILCNFHHIHSWFAIGFLRFRSNYKWRYLGLIVHDRIVGFHALLCKRWVHLVKAHVDARDALIWTIRNYFLIIRKVTIQKRRNKILDCSVLFQFLKGIMSRECALPNKMLIKALFVI